MSSVKVANFFHDQPLFGLDIGHGSLKVMQLAERPDKVPIRGYHPRVLGYGFATFDRAALKDGVIVQPEVVAKAAYELFEKHMVGQITTRRAALAIPTYRTFSRSVQLPKLKPKELREAVQLEAEQYIPMPLEELYLDYQVIKRTDTATELMVVAVPRTIVDSFLELARILDLEPILIEPTLSSCGRLFSTDNQSDVPAIIINFGSVSSDISIFDKNVVVTGTVQGGGENFTESIKQKLGVSSQEAGLIKTRYGLSVSKKQSEIRAALEPTLQQIIKEIQRMMRYYEQRYGTSRPIGQVITLGGGANMPGLSEYLIEVMRMAVRASDPWQYFNYEGMQPPAVADRPMYATAAGLSLAQSREVFEP